jgi:PAS domain S-box-containing protein
MKPCESHVVGSQGQALTDKGEMAEYIRTLDWSRTPIGPREQWSASLRTVVDVLIETQFPMALLWGQELILIYNDACRVICGNKHPAALGRSTREIWPEVWHINQPIFAAVMDRGETIWFEDRLFPINRSGRLEDAYFTLCYSPVRKDDCSVGGVLVILKETTERIKSVKAMERTRDPLAEAQKVAHVGSFEYVAAIQTTVWSEEEYRIYGLDPAGPSPTYDEMLRECIHPDDATLLHETFTKAMQSGSVYELEHRIVRPDGSVRWVYDRAQPYLDEKGKLARYIGTTLDITERNRVAAELELHRNHLEELVQERTKELEAEIRARRQAEVALRESEEQFRALSESSLVGVYFLQDGKFDYVNPAMAAVFGYSVTEMIGMAPRDITHPDCQVMVDQSIRRRITGEAQSIQYEVRARRRDGSVRDVEIYGKRVETERGIGIIGTLIDITDRKRVEQDVQRMNRELHAISLCEQALIRARDETTMLQEICRIICEEAGHRMAWVGYALHDEAKTVQPMAWAGHEEGYLKISHFSWADTELGKGPAGRAIRSGVSVASKNLETDSALKPWALALLARGYQSGICLPLKDETEDVLGVLVIYSSNIDAFSETEIKLLEKLAADLAFGIRAMRNRSERKRAEEDRAKLSAQLLQSQKMESVGRLAGGVAHDFNNMLGVILGHVEMAMDQVEKSQPLFNDLQEIQKAAQRSADLTRQLLAFGRKQIISPKILDLNDTVTDMMKMIRRLVGENIDVVWKPAANLWSIKADHSQIDQILANLCVNARDAITGTGKLIIETGNKILDEAYCLGNEEAVSGDYVLLAASDTGCGMTPETQSHIFEPFFTTKDVGKGTGLGLSTVYGIVKQNDGFINVYSEPGHGSTFNIYLPRHKGDAARNDVPGVTTSAARGSETILLVEDEPTMMKITMVMLEKQGYTVLTAGAPTDALRLAGEHAGKINLLLTDVIMPEMNGRDLANILKQLYPTLKCLFISAYSENVIETEGILDKNSFFLKKPFSRYDLSTKIREVLDKP